MNRAWILGFLLIGCTAPAPTSPPAPVEETPKVAQQEPEAKPPLTPVKEKGKPSQYRVYALSTLEKGKVKLPGRTIDAWIMDDDYKREEGMMWLSDDEVKPDQGMLFAFPNEEPRQFWMRNTLIPLDIVYIGAKGKVVSIAKGQAQNETGLPSTGPAQYVLELKQGQAAKLGIKPGTVLGLPKTEPK